MPLLLLPALVLGLVLLWLVLLPLLLVQRYRRGQARQRAIGWVVRTNAWLLLLSALVFLLGAWLAGHWIADAGLLALAGLAGGLAVGVFGFALARIESTPGGHFHTPNRWLVLLLTALVAARIALGMWQAAQHLRKGHPPEHLLAQQGSLVALAGVLLGYYLAYAWGLRRSMRARS